MKKFELVIVGGGLTATRAIKSYREAGGGGRVALLAKEAALPYHRPALSKRYLRGETPEVGGVGPDRPGHLVSDGRAVYPSRA